MNRFFLDPADIQGDQVCMGKAQAHQICHVLRLRAQDRIVVLDNRGSEFEVALTDVGPSRVSGTILERRPSLGEPQVDLTLYQSMLARDKFELVLQKCTELGVRWFVPVITERSIVRSSQAFREGRLDRWGRILTEAAEQCQRGLVPGLRPPVRFDQVLADLEGCDLRLMGCPRAPGRSLSGLLADGSALKEVALFIGPEAGFSDREMDLACAAGWRPFSLGRRILRTETAAVVASALVLHALGQMEPQG